MWPRILAIASGGRAYVKVILMRATAFTAIINVIFAVIKTENPLKIMINYVEEENPDEDN